MRKSSGNLLTFLPVLALLAAAPAAAAPPQAASPQSTARTPAPAGVARPAPPRPAAAPLSRLDYRSIIRGYMEAGDLLGGRVMIKKLFRILKSPVDKAAVRSLLLRYEDLGDDLLYSWEAATTGQASQTPGTGLVTIDPLLANADSLMLAREFDKAALKFQEAARWMQRRRAYEKARPQPNADILANLDRVYPYVLHGLARSYYGGGRYSAAWQVYSWIPQGYSRYGKTLFERMWAAYKARWADHALGAVASQRSRFFSDYLNPEVYLIQLYVLKLLCRQKDIDKLLVEIREFKERLNSGRFTYADYAGSEVYSRRLLKAAMQTKIPDDRYVSERERRVEKGLMQKMLETYFASSRKQLIEQLTSVEAYANLATIPGIQLGLERPRKVTGRAEFLDRGLEVWPADGEGEDWLDEIGHHVYLGESLCAGQ